MEEGRLEEARTILEDLGSFPGAESMLADTRYGIAERMVSGSKDPAALLTAAETLRADGRDGAEELADTLISLFSGSLLHSLSDGIVIHH